tara:strand:- start:425 stop:1423 length:999 start_codon:yes stop_codon:yes gene_type:complete
MPLSQIQTTNNQVIPNLGRRNMLINGDFQVWQRSTSGTVNSYTCDRWYGWGYQQAVTRQQAENATSNTGRFALRNAHNDATSNQFSAIAQTLETNDTAKARGKKLTFSIDVKKGSAFTGNLYLQIVTRTDSEATINAGTRQVLISEDISSSLTTSLQRFTVTTSSVVAQNALTVGVNVYHGSTSGTDANNFFQVERAQLEIGDTSTEFESISFGETFSLCRRYFQRVGEITASNLGSMPGIQSTRNTTNQAILSYQCPVPLRATPSVSKSGNFTLYGSGQGITLGSLISVSTNQHLLQQVTFTATATGINSNTDQVLYGSGTNTYIQFDSEF